MAQPYHRTRGTGSGFHDNETQQTELTRERGPSAIAPPSATNTTAVGTRQFPATTAPKTKATDCVRGRSGGFSGHSSPPSNLRNARTTCATLALVPPIAEVLESSRAFLPAERPTAHARLPATAPGTIRWRAVVNALTRNCRPASNQAPKNAPTPPGHGFP